MALTPICFRALTPTCFGAVIGIVDQLLPLTLKITCLRSEQILSHFRVLTFMRMMQMNIKQYNHFSTTQHINNLTSPTRTSTICLTAVSPFLSLYGIVHIMYIIHLKSKLWIKKELLKNNVCPLLCGVAICFNLYFLKGCVRFIFASLFCMSKREHLWSKEKCFRFHFESSFRSWDNWSLNSTRKTFYWITWEINAVW